MAEPVTSKLDPLRHRGDEPHLLREVVRTYHALVTGFSRKTGLPASRFWLIRLLAVAETKLGVMDLARQLGVNASAVTRQLHELERDGLVVRRVDSQDARRSYVSLSPKGKRLFKRIHERHHELERELSTVMSVEEIGNAVSALGKLRAFIEGLP